MEEYWWNVGINLVVYYNGDTEQKWVFYQGTPYEDGWFWAMITLIVLTMICCIIIVFFKNDKLTCPTITRKHIHFLAIAPMVLSFLPCCFILTGAKRREWGIATHSFDSCHPVSPFPTFSTKKYFYSETCCTILCSLWSTNIAMEPPKFLYG